MSINVIDSAEDLKVCFLGDEHLGHPNFKEEKHAKLLDKCLKEKIRIIHMGDALESATRRSVGAGVYNQIGTVEDQSDKIEERLRPLAKEGLLSGMHIGNHEFRITKSVGFNVTRNMCKILGVKYFDVGKLHYIRAGRNRYSAFTTHGKSGARYVHTKMNAAKKVGKNYEVDIFAMGHTHALAKDEELFYRVNRRNRTMGERKKKYLLTGSFLGYWGSYAQTAGYPPFPTGAPIVTFFSDKKGVQVELWGK